MKILYSMSNRLGAAELLQRLLKDPPADCKIRVAGYSSALAYLSKLDWTLDGVVYVPPNLAHSPKELAPFDHFNEEIENFNPDLVISDANMLSAIVCQELSIPLWSVSPLHFLDGVIRGIERSHYQSTLSRSRDSLSRIKSKAIRCFIHSPFGSIRIPWKLKAGYEWMSPPINLAKESNGGAKIALLSDPSRRDGLIKVLSNLSTIPHNHLQASPEFYQQLRNSWCLTMGETGLITDAIQARSFLAIVPKTSDPEATMNAVLCQELGLGQDLLQAELMLEYGMEDLEKSQEAQISNKLPTDLRFPTLKERIEEYARSI